MSALMVGVLALMLATVAVAVGGVSASAASRHAQLTSSSSKSTYVIGDDDDLSGPVATYGTAGLVQFQAAVKYFNSHGGINGHPVKIVTSDAAASGANASSAAEQLIDVDHAIALVGFTLSSDCGAVGSIATSDKVPIFCISTALSNLRPLQKYVFSINEVEPQEIPGLLQFVKDDLKLPKGSTFITWTEVEPTALLAASTAAKEGVAAGYKDVLNEVTPLGVASATAPIASIVNAKPDFLIVESTPTFFQPLAQALEAAGNNAPIIVLHDGIGFPGLVSIDASDIYDLALTTFAENLNTKAAGEALMIKADKAAGLNTTSKINNAVGPPAFLAMYGLLSALKKCGGCTGSSLATEVSHTALSFPGLVSGTYGWTTTSHVPYQQMLVYRSVPHKLPTVVKSGLKLGSPEG
jgi:ABC-type branched-subunit amino acid transport system substrate-binding protein